MGVYPTKQALSIAEELGLDLVEISPDAKPPVVPMPEIETMVTIAPLPETHSRVFVRGTVFGIVMLCSTLFKFQDQPAPAPTPMTSLTIGIAALP